jgi:23S rRNA (uracil1939-C5)-methyltransferase
LKHLVIRSINDKSLITIVSSKKLDLQDYCDYITEKLKNIGISQIIGDSDDEILSGKYTHLSGIDSIEIEEFGLKYTIDNRGFLQVNNEIKKEIYAQILEWIGSTDNVIDAYGGAGLLSGIISKKCKSVVGIEINKSASKSAQNMSKINGLHNTVFITDDVKNRISECLNQNIDSVLILDPARSGCEDVVLDKILESNLPKKIIYLSCNVATLARDLIKLKDYYSVASSIGYNMFPNTKHIETLVCLQRRV